MTKAFQSAHEAKMHCIVLTFMLAFVPAIRITHAIGLPPRKSIRGGIFTFQNETLLEECISGAHLRTYDKSCAPYMSSQMEAVVIAVMQVCHAGNALLEL